jgi:hypothetical protein
MEKCKFLYNTNCILVSIVNFIHLLCSKIFLIYTYKEIQNGAVAKSYMRKGFLIYRVQMINESIYLGYG